ncbi:CRISPR-associated endoribonuclease Cas6 [Methanosarcina sp. UBA5]|uniref:CRISPR-associated endoribonuclease Cas6 n=1 Tax=Methanosarcina sp. UBA5 TaxID=1915593 RepID=UPI0025EBCF79|nr:CRISPR-associated endoribonuclease Cas6 [Methanosarcina sp. UBA5]
MRFKVNIRKISPDPLHYDYQYGLASVLYKRLAIANETFANELHSHKGFKHYTFSNLSIEDRIPDRNGLNFHKSNFIISSPDAEFIKNFAKGIISSPDFYLGNKDRRIDFIVESVEMLPKISFTDCCTFRTLSPVYIKTQEKVGDKFTEEDLYPMNSKFYENLKDNLFDRYQEFSGQKIDSGFFEAKVTDFKKKRVTINNSYRRCSLMDITLKADPRLIEFAYDAGLGEKTAMGFGCMDIM